MTRAAPKIADLPAEIDQNWLRRFRKSLASWYGANARDLPWRRTHDPYRIWISEIMLQQTTVAAVIPYFERFIARFPTVQALAAGEEQDVLRLWEGLGYYSRGRNIHKAARVLVETRNGGFPDNVAELVALPGIGRYTAGAIASFAFDTRAPIVEANTLRLYSRLLAFEGDPKSTAGQQTLWTFAERILPRTECGAFNQALMELGATVCTPTKPQCERCPVRSCCGAFAQGKQDIIPRPAARPAITEVTEASVAVRNGDAYLLRQRRAGERWAGLWDFPRFEIASDLVAESTGPKRKASAMPAKLKRVLEAGVLEQTGIAVRTTGKLAEMRHGVTRFRIRLLCYLAEVTDPGKVNGQLRWIGPEDFADLPLSVTGRKFASLLQRLP